MSTSGKGEMLSLLKGMLGQKDTEMMWKKGFRLANSRNLECGPHLLEDLLSPSSLSSPCHNPCLYPTGR